MQNMHKMYPLDKNLLETNNDGKIMEMAQDYFRDIVIIHIAIFNFIVSL